MRDEDKSKEQLMDELADMRRQVAALKESETERKKAEEALRESEDRFSKAFHSCPTLMAITRMADGCIVEVNDAFTDALGCRREEIVGRSTVDLGLWGTPEERDTFTKEAREHGQARDYEVLVRTKSGEVGLVLLSGEIVSLNGEPHLITVATDITERKRAQEALRESEKKYRDLVENMREVIYSVNSDGLVTYVSPAIESIMGYAPSELVGQPFSTFVHEEDLSRTTERFKGILAGNVEPSEYRILKKTGETCWISVSSRPILHRDKAAGIQGVVTDITERKRAKEALRKSEEKYRSLFETCPDGIAITTLDGKILDANQSYRDMVGYTMDELGEVSYVELTPEKWHEAEAESVDVLMSKKGYGTFEKEYVRKDGTVFPVSLTGWVIADAQGNPEKLGAFVRDISDRKRAEEEMEALARFPSEDPYPVLRISLDGTIMYANDASGPLLSSTAIQPGQRLPGHWRELLLDVLTSGSRTEAEVQYGDRAISLTFAPVVDAGYVNVYGLDITERKRAEEALRESEERFRSLSESSPIGVFHTDSEGRVLYTNKRWQEITGLTLQESLGFGWSRALHPDDRKPILEEWDRCLSEEKGWSGEFRFISTSRDVRWVHTRTAPIRSETGHVMGHVGSNEDITERKRAEGELRASREELRALSAHLQSVREEERAGIAREIHDELGQSLTALKMDLSWLSSRLPEGEEPFSERVGSMSSLIDTTIREVRRISAELRPRLLDDLGLIAAIEWEMDKFERRTGIRCDFGCGSKDVLFERSISTALYRILQETLTNVARHADATSVDVSFREEPDTLVLSVKDDGKGIAEEEISDPRAFGLIGMRERARYLGGKLTISGVRGKGTTVAASIPLARKGEVK